MVTAARAASAPSAGRAKPLDSHRIISAALTIIERDGLEALTMRALGAELGVDAMAVYRHLPNKKALFDGIVESVWNELELPPPCKTWQAELRLLAMNVRKLLSAHANALPIISTRATTGSGGLAALERGLVILKEAGLSAREGMEVLSAASSFVIGHALAEFGRPPQGVDDVSDEELLATLTVGEASRNYPNLMEAMTGPGGPPDFDAIFERGLDTLIEGVEARLTRTRLTRTRTKSGAAAEKS
jgi:TetR/AcrR family transcriptional regulator, tetracycline repressor protein